MDRDDWPVRHTEILVESGFSGSHVVFDGDHEAAGIVGKPGKKNVARAGWHSYTGASQLVLGFTLEDAEIAPTATQTCTAKGSTWPVGAKWGSRLYGLRDATVRRVWTHGLHCSTDGHAFYHSTAGGEHLFEHCLMENLAGQALQLRCDVGKHGGPWQGPNIAGKTTIREVAALDCGQGEGRGSYPFTLWALGRPDSLHDIEIERCYVRNAWAVPDGKGYRGYGVLLIQNPDSVQTHTMPSVTIHHFVAHTEQNDRYVFINGVANLIVTDCKFTANGGNDKIELDRVDYPQYVGMQPVESVIWKRNQGNAQVFWRGQQIARADEEFEISGGQVWKRTP